MLRCRELAEQADAFLDGEIGLGRRLRFRLHMSMCKSCARFMGQMRMTRALIVAEVRRDTADDAGRVNADIDSILNAFDKGKLPGG
ncbi:zf-HC2 domain-containing protein [Aquicoccus sp. G2-2]|uniref:zf-HC2 domain-containing protein n=1 Tax=Aquicoccus sp. G2-2 TaxID=3092120 RepID=UPI002ADF0EE6|nr:zf-HC2 domain-containing protein [Aquicoccus sp. G2-2]MEA1113491.1 zf-HC2 domain-containing protein [Aquicoccus sp. G2-2]